MRKFWIGAALSGLILASAAAGAWAAGGGVRKNIEVEYRNIKITVDGKQVNVGDDEPFVYVEKSRTFVPARYLAEALGAKVGWNQQTSTVEVYTSDYVKETIQGEYKLWSLPGQGFSIQAPRGFLRINLGIGGMLQLALPDMATGNNTIVGVTRNDPPGDGSTLPQRAENLIAGLGQVLLPGARITSTTQDGNKLTAEGTATLNQIPSTFTLRLVATEQGDWLVLAITPTSLQPQMGPVIRDILNSFTLTP